MEFSSYPELQALLKEASAFLEGKSNIQSLYRLVSRAKGWAVITKAHPNIIELLDYWVENIDRFWNEWNFHNNPLAEKEFHSWLKKQLLIPENSLTQEELFTDKNNKS